MKVTKLGIVAIIVLIAAGEVYAVESELGWPVDLGSLATSPMVVDFDGNLSNGLEIVVGRSPITSNGYGSIKVLNYTGSVIWSKSTASAGEGIGGVPAIGNLIGESSLAVVLGTSGGNIYVWYSNGTGLLNSTGFFASAGNFVRSVTIADVDGDGLSEIIVGLDDGNVRVYRINGTLIWSRATGGAVKSVPAVGDIDWDGDLEVIVGSNDYRVYAWHHNGVLVVGWPQATGGAVPSSPALCDLDRDNYPEIIVGSQDAKVYIWRYNGTPLSGWPQTTGGYIISSPSCGDIDGDGSVEVVVGSSDGKVYVWHSNGTPLSGWPQTTGENVISSPSLGDIDGDGEIDVVVGSADGKLYAWHYNGTNVSGWPYTIGAPISSSPAIADVDMDNKTEVMISAENDKLYLLDAGGEYNKTKVPWPMFRHDPSHTASSSPIVRITSPEPIGWQHAYEDQPFYLNLSSIVFSEISQVSFNSSCTDPLGSIVSYTWTSNINGTIGNSQSFTTSLSRGAHRINLTVLTDSYSKGIAATDVFIYNGTVNFSDNTPLFDINSTTGEINFTANNSQVGDYIANITISDSEGLLGYKVFGLTILNTNDPPVIVTRQNFTIQEDSPWSYDFNATDDDLIYGDMLTWSINNSNITLDPETGVASWTPTNEWVGNNTVNITVTDSEGASDSFVFNIEVENTNDLPSLAYIPPQYATVGYEFYLNVSAYASDPDLIYGDFLTYSDDTDIFNISTTGIINFTPLSSQAGVHNITITVTDSEGKNSSRSFILTVTFDKIILECYTDKSDYYLNENVTIICDTSNEGGEMSVSSIWAEITNPICNTVERVDLVDAGSKGKYRGTFTNAFKNGTYNATIYAEEPGYPRANTTINFSIYTPVSWRYWFNITVGAGSQDRLDDMVEVPINFTEKLAEAGAYGKTFDENSIRVYETDTSGNILKEVPYLFEKTQGEPSSEHIFIPGDKAFAGSTYPGFPASYAVDGSLSTYCILDGGVPNYLGVDLGSPVFVWNVTIRSYSGYYYPVDYVIQVSLDGVSYRDVVSVAGNSNWYISHAFTPVQARYVRIYITKNAGGSSYCRIYDFKVFPVGGLYNSTTNAYGNLTWRLDGETLANTERYYQIRFDVIENGEKHPPGYVVNLSNATPASGLIISYGNTLENSLPTARAEASNSTLRNVPLTFNASYSSHPNGYNLYYYWDFGDCTSGRGEVINHTYTASSRQDLGIKNITLFVSDDKGGVNYTQIHVNVTNNPPSLNISLNFTIKEDELFTYDINATDTPADQLTFSDNASFFDVDPSTGLINFTPNNTIANKNYSINITVSDGIDSDSKIINFEILNVNDPPVLEGIPDFVDENKTYQGQEFYLNVSAFLSDPDLIHGEIHVWSDDTSLFNISPTTGVINFTPTNEDAWRFYNPYVITITVSDASGASDSDDFKLFIENVNDPPNITSWSPLGDPVINETENLTFTVNATDPDLIHGDTLTYTWYVNGVKNRSGTNLDSFTFYAGIYSNGTYNISVNVSDTSGGSVTYNWTLTVLDLNQPPELVPIGPLFAGINASPNATQQPFYFDVDASDPDNDTLIFSDNASFFDIDPFTGVINFTPNVTLIGNYTVNITVNDSKGGIDYEEVLLTIDYIGDPPNITSWSPLGDPVINETENLTFTVNATPLPLNFDWYVNGTRKGGGDSYTFLTDYTSSGTYNITVVVSDMYRSDTHEWTLTVLNLNRPPVLSTIGEQVATQDEPFYYIVDASDPDNDTLSFYDNTSLFEIEDNGTISFTPTNADVGEHYINITVVDSNGAMTSQTFKLVVKNVNDPPNITSWSPLGDPVINETENLTFTVNAIDPDENITGDNVTFSWYVNGVLIATGPSYTFYTNYTSNGTYDITVRASDGSNFSTHSWNLTVLNLNRKPNIRIVSPTNGSNIEWGRPFNIITEYNDPDGDSLNFSIYIEGNLVATASNLSGHWFYTDVGLRKIRVEAVDVWGEASYSEVTVSVSKPDLTLNTSDISFSNIAPREGQEIIVYANVSNINNATTDYFTVSFIEVREEEILIGNISTKVLPYSSSLVSLKWTPSCGDNIIKVVVDVEDYIEETNESNNEAYRSIHVSCGSPSTGRSSDTGWYSLDPGANIVDEKIMRGIIYQLRDGEFYSMPLVVAGPLVVLQIYPEVDIPNLREILVHPVERLSGDIYEITAQMVMRKFKSAKAAVIARGDLSVDSIAAIAYAKSKGIPILLTRPEELPRATEDAIKTLKPREVIIVGGRVAVSEDVESSLEEAWSVRRIWGKTRYETAVELAEAAGNPLTIIVTDGENPSLDAVIFSAVYKAPIIYVKGDEIPEVTREYLLSHRRTMFGLTRVIMTDVSDIVARQIESLIHGSSLK